MFQRTGPLVHAEGSPQGGVDKGLGFSERVRDAHAFGQAGGDGGGESAAGSMVIGVGNLRMAFLL